MVKKTAAVFLCAMIAVFTSCEGRKNAPSAHSVENKQAELTTLLQNPKLDPGSRYAMVNQIAENLLSINDYQGTILFLTDWVERNPDDKYNSYWLLMTAYAYVSIKAEPIAEYYFDRILRQYPDLLVKGKSVHFLCLKNLIQISKTPRNRIKYFNEMINRFPSDVSSTELYLRLALEYEKDGEWNPALKSFALFLEQPDASRKSANDLSAGFHSPSFSYSSASRRYSSVMLTSEGKRLIISLKYLIRFRGVRLIWIRFLRQRK